MTKNCGFWAVWKIYQCKYQLSGQRQFNFYYISICNIFCHQNLDAIKKIPFSNIPNFTFSQYFSGLFQQSHHYCIRKQLFSWVHTKITLNLSSLLLPSPDTQTFFFRLFFLLGTTLSFFFLFFFLPSFWRTSFSIQLTDNQDIHITTKW